MSVRGPKDVVRARARSDSASRTKQFSDESSARLNLVEHYLGLVLAILVEAGLFDVCQYSFSRMLLLANYFCYRCLLQHEIEILPSVVKRLCLSANFWRCRLGSCQSNTVHSGRYGHLKYLLVDNKHV